MIKKSFPEQKKAKAVVKYPDLYLYTDDPDNIYCHLCSGKKYKMSSENSEMKRNSFRLTKNIILCLDCKSALLVNKYKVPMYSDK